MVKVRIGLKTKLNFKVIVDNKIKVRVNKVQVTKEKYKVYIQDVGYGQYQDTTQGKDQLQGQCKSKVTVNSINKNQHDFACFYHIYP